MEKVCKARKQLDRKLVCLEGRKGKGRDGVTRGAWGQELPQKFTKPLALEFLKIAMHCRHFHNLFVVILGSFVEFWANQKGVVHENFACFARCRHFDKFCPPNISSLVPSLEKGKRNRMKERKLDDKWRKKEIEGKRK